MTHVIATVPMNRVQAGGAVLAEIRTRSGAADDDPTELARHVYRELAAKLAASHPNLRVARVTVYESDHSYATYRE